MRGNRNWKHRLRPAPLMALVVWCGLTGCSSQWPSLRRQQLGPSLPSDATVAHVVDRLNSNILQVDGWRSTEVQITGRMMPVALRAYIAVERPRRLRLRASSPVGEEADLGSNGEWYWLWMKRGPRKLFYAHHDEISQMAQDMQIPFQPDWLMQALGVIPIDAAECTLHSHPDNKRMVQLIAETRTPDGRTVRRAIDVDTRHSLIKAYSLLDEQGTLLARAVLSNHRREGDSGAVLPHRIQLEWPQTRMDLTLSINRIDVNPTHVAEQTWQLPTKPGYQPFNLAARQRPYMPVAGPPIERDVREARPQAPFSDSEEFASEDQNPFETISRTAERPSRR